MERFENILVPSLGSLEESYIIPTEQDDGLLQLGKLGPAFAWHLVTLAGIAH